MSLKKILEVLGLDLLNSVAVIFDVQLRIAVPAAGKEGVIAFGQDHIC
ncbi:MAG: hypothetical protein WDM87_08095 [Terracidiphilus sp.]